MKTKPSYYEEVANQLIDQMKAGTAPWQKPWQAGASSGVMPVNVKTGNRYKGINAIRLMAQGHSDNRWMTYNQAKDEGAQVRKGEKSTSIQYWKTHEEQTKKDKQGKPVLDGDGKPVKVQVELERPKCFFANVFNAEQIDGLPEREIKPQEWNAVDRAENILQASGAKIQHKPGDRAFYSPMKDEIVLPEKSQFDAADKYYATALHELGHWTGHESRLDRDLANPFGSEGYAKEELRAEIYSMMAGSEIGIGHDPSQHAAYVKSWIKALEEDPKEIFRAAADAEKIMGFVMALEQKQEQVIDQKQQFNEEQERILNRIKTASVDAIEGYSAIESFNNLSNSAKSLGVTTSLSETSPFSDGETNAVFLKYQYNGEALPVNTELTLGDGKALTSIDEMRVEGTGYTSDHEWQSAALTQALSAEIAIRKDIEKMIDNAPQSQSLNQGQNDRPIVQAIKDSDNEKIVNELAAVISPEALSIDPAQMPKEWTEARVKTGHIEIEGTAEVNGFSGMASIIEFVDKDGQTHESGLFVNDDPKVAQTVAEVLAEVLNSSKQLAVAENNLSEMLNKEQQEQDVQFTLSYSAKGVSGTEQYADLQTAYLDAKIEMQPLENAAIHISDSNGELLASFSGHETDFMSPQVAEVEKIVQAKATELENNALASVSVETVFSNLDADYKNDLLIALADSGKTNLNELVAPAKEAGSEIEYKQIINESFAQVLYDSPAFNNDNLTDALADTEFMIVNASHNAIASVGGLKGVKNVLNESGPSQRETFSKPEKIYIDVPFKEKELAKDAGAKWDRQEKSWYIPAGAGVSQDNLLDKWPQKGTVATAKTEVPASQEQPKKVDSVEPVSMAKPMAQPAQDKTYLAVPFSQKGEAKAAGAKWDKDAKSWYATPSSDMAKLQKFLPDNVPLQQQPAMRPDEEFAEALRELGFSIPAGSEHPIMDGSKQRCAVNTDSGIKKSGFYVAHSDGLPAGYAINNKTGAEMKWKSKGYHLSDEEKANLNATAAAKLEERAKALSAKQDEISEKVTKQASVLSAPVQPTPYMQSKGINVHDGVLTDKTGQATIIPAKDIDGKQWTSQYINSDGSKLFAKDSKKEGCFHVVGNNLDAAPAIIIGEGYATATTVSETVGFSTVVAFDSGNLPAVAKALHDKYPDKPVLIVGDDDIATEMTQGINPGREKAEEAAKLCSGKAIFPTFAPNENSFDAGVKPVTPESFKSHTEAIKGIEAIKSAHEGKTNSITVLEKNVISVLEKNMLEPKQIAQLDKVKGRSDFNDLAQKSSLGKEAVNRQVMPVVTKMVQDKQREISQQIKQQQTQQMQEKLQQTKTQKRTMKV